MVDSIFSHSSKIEDTEEKVLKLIIKGYLPVNVDCNGLKGTFYPTALISP